ncbi:MAG TPA: entericidin A/B family lipoprotein [Methylophilaceae bacterium]|nr:entericidin A/B family lipoprotein [Methylophilaceae bacterium]
MRTALSKFSMLVMIAVSVIGLSGCNTMQGLGKDVSKLGDKIENKAEEKKSY